VNVYGAAEVPKEQAGKLTASKIPGQGSLVPRLLPRFLLHTVQKMGQKAGEEPGNEARP